MKVRRTKPYVCVDVDFADHFRFQEARDLDLAAGSWLRCLAYSRAQEQDGLVRATWLQRAFVGSLDRVEDLVRVGLLRQREDGDYELHAYAPRNQTRAMLEADRNCARERMAAARKSKASRRKRRSPEQSPNERRTTADVRANEVANQGSLDLSEHAPGPSFARTNGRPNDDERDAPRLIRPSYQPPAVSETGADSEALASTRQCSPEQEANERRTSALVPSSTSSSTSNSINYTSTSFFPSLVVGGDKDPDHQDVSVIRGVQGIAVSRKLGQHVSNGAFASG